MPEENVNDTPKTAEWYERQIEQYQRELNALNPRLDAALARIGELESREELAARKQADLAREIEIAARLEQALREDLAGAQERADKNAAACAASAQRIRELETEIAAGQTREASLRAGNARKLAALQACLGAASEFIGVVNQGLAGEA